MIFGLVSIFSIDRNVYVSKKYSWKNDLDFINWISSGTWALVSEARENLQAAPFTRKFGYKLNVADCISLILPIIFLWFCQLYLSDSQCPLLLAPESDGRRSARRASAEEDEAQTSAAQFCVGAHPTSMWVRAPCNVVRYRYVFVFPFVFIFHKFNLAGCEVVPAWSALREVNLCDWTNLWRLLMHQVPAWTGCPSTWGARWWWGRRRSWKKRGGGVVLACHSTTPLLLTMAMKAWPGHNVFSK